MKDEMRQEIKAFLLEQGKRGQTPVKTDASFKTLCVITATDWNKAADVASRKFSLQIAASPYLKGIYPFIYRLTELPLVRDDDPLGFYQMTEIARMQLAGRR